MLFAFKHEIVLTFKYISPCLVSILAELYSDSFCPITFASCTWTNLHKYETIILLINVNLWNICLVVMISNTLVQSLIMSR
jgi:hypothetical protein